MSETRDEMPAMQTYARKPEPPIRAVQWHKPGDHPGVEAEQETGLHHLLDETGEVIDEVEATDWIVETATGGLRVAPDDIFRATYQPAAAAEQSEHHRQACIRQSHEIEQILGKALGYPWYKDDPKNFPDATEADGVCVGDHVAESLADEAAERVRDLQGKLAAAEARPGEATRKVLEWAAKYEADLASGDADGPPLTGVDVPAALRECGIEVPR